MKRVVRVLFLVALVSAAAYAADFYAVIEDYADGSWRQYSVNTVYECRSSITFSGPAPTEARSAPLPNIPRCPVGGGPYFPEE